MFTTFCLQLYYHCYVHIRVDLYYGLCTHAIIILVIMQPESHHWKNSLIRVLPSIRQKSDMEWNGHAWNEKKIWAQIFPGLWAGIQLTAHCCCSCASNSYQILAAKFVTIEGNNLAQSSFNCGHGDDNTVITRSFHPIRSVPTAKGRFANKAHRCNLMANHKIIRCIWPANPAHVLLPSDANVLVLVTQVGASFKVKSLNIPRHWAVKVLQAAIRG